MFDKRNKNIMAKTVDGMLSDDWKERFVAEYKQTVNRRNRLKKAMGNFTGDMFDLREKQLHIMNEYVDVLKVIAKECDISLK